MPKIKLNIKRPRWDSVKKAYVEINEIGKDEYDDYAKARLRYAFLGGKIQKTFEKEETSYVNTCAVRVSYALNKGGMPLKEALEIDIKKNSKYKSLLQSIKSNAEIYNRIDKNKNYYITNSIDMETFLWIKWGTPELMQKNMTTKAQNIIFFNNLKNAKKQGVVTMRIDFSDAKGHTTLWDKNYFVDDSNYLVEAIIKDNDIHYNPLVKEIHFWELK